MKKLFAMILIFSMLGGCAVTEEPENPVLPDEETPVSVPKEIPDIPEEEPAIPEEAENELEKFEATDIQEIQLYNDSVAYVYAFNRDVNLEEGFKTTVSSYNFETAEAEILFGGNAFFEYGDMFYVREVAFSNPWIFTGKAVMSKGIADNPDKIYSLGGRPGDCDFDFENKRYVFVYENDKSKLYSRNIETNEEKMLFDVSGEGERRFINSPKVCQSSGNILFVDCDYSAMHPKRLICIDFYGNVIFEENAEGSFNYELRWLTGKKFALFFLTSDEEKPFVRVYDIEKGLEYEKELDFMVQTSQNDMEKSYPLAVLCEYVPQSDFRYRIWLYNFEEGSAKELYISPTRGIIHGFDLSPSGKTIAWIENKDIKKLDIG